MSDITKVHAAGTAVGFDLKAGQSQGWIATGWSPGMAIVVTAWPVGVPGNWPRSLQVRNLSFQPDGTFTFEVYNDSTQQFAHYGITTAWTDVPTVDLSR